MKILHNIKIPAPVSLGEPVKAEHYNAVVTALQNCIQLAISAKTQSSADIGVSRSESGGQTLFLKKIVRGGGGASVIQPLTLVTTRPSYIPEDAVSVAAGSKRFWITWGEVNGIVATNWNHVFDISLAAETIKYLKLRVILAPTADEPVVSFTHELWNTYDQHAAPAWGANGNRPSHMFLSVGQISVSDAGAATIYNSGGGSFTVGNHVHKIEQNASAGWTFSKAMHYARLNY